MEKKKQVPHLSTGGTVPSPSTDDVATELSPGISVPIRSLKHYLDAVESSGRYQWRVYHYDLCGDVEIAVKKSDDTFSSKEEAIDAGRGWADDNGYGDAETVF